MSNTEPSGNYQGTVPQGDPMMQGTPQTSPVHGLHDAAPMQPTAVPAKPEAVTGPGGPSVSVPKVGKGGA